MKTEKIIRKKAKSFVVKVWNQRDFSAIPEIMANPVLLHIKERDISSTHTHLRAVIDRWHERYHGFQFENEALIVEGNMAVLLLTLRGIPVDAEEAEAIAVRHVFILRFENSLIVEAWELNDFP